MTVCVCIYSESLVLCSIKASCSSSSSSSCNSSKFLLRQSQSLCNLHTQRQPEKGRRGGGVRRKMLPKIAPRALINCSSHNRRRRWLSTLPSSFNVDVLVCGAGVVGLAIARAFARAGREVLVVEAEKSFGTQTSARNSEVIHAGIYYPPGSLKASLCVRGRQMLYTFCEEHGVPFRRCGKLIVATSDKGDDGQRLEALYHQAHSNGVIDLQRLSSRDVARMEPHVHCMQALFSPSTGILDSHQFMLALLGDAEDHGASIAYRSRVQIKEVSPAGFVSLTTVEGEGKEPSTDLRPRLFINTTGLSALPLARQIGRRPAGLPPFPPPSYAKGNYFRLGPPPLPSSPPTLPPSLPPFNCLVYPLPETAGLGIHATIDLGGQVRFGPDVEWVSDPDDLSVNPSRAESFYASIRRYFPSLQDGQLVADYAGIRPKIQSPHDKTASDFILEGGPSSSGGGREGGMEGIINCVGIESPGLTASLAIAEWVKQRAMG